MDILTLVDFDHFLKMSVGLFAITDPLGNIPIFLGLTAALTARGRNTTALVAVLAFLVLSSLFIVFGEAILEAFSVTIEAFMVAGGILLLLDGIWMIRASASELHSDDAAGTDPVSVGLVPLAIPLLAGPGALSTLIVYPQSEPGMPHRVATFGAVIVVGLSIYAIFRGAAVVGPRMGARAQLALHRIMGLVVLTIGVEFIMDGIGGHFGALDVIH